MFCFRFRFIGFLSSITHWLPVPPNPDGPFITPSDPAPGPGFEELPGPLLGLPIVGVPPPEGSFFNQFETSGSFGGFFSSGFTLVGLTFSFFGLSFSFIEISLKSSVIVFVLSSDVSGGVIFSTGGATSVF